MVLNSLKFLYFFTGGRLSLGIFCIFSIFFSSVQAMDGGKHGGSYDYYRSGQEYSSSSKDEEKLKTIKREVKRILNDSTSITCRETALTASFQKQKYF
jgi:hypothetical protein